MKRAQIIENIILLQSYYKFLFLGKFLEYKIKQENFSSDVNDIKIFTGDKSYFVLKSKMVQSLLENIYKNPEKKNLFGYLIEISAFRGIFSTFKELIDNELVFQRFLKSYLTQDYFAFEQIIKFLRNILSHSTTSRLNLKTEDFQKQKEYLKKQMKIFLDFDFNYSKKFPEWKGNKEYGIKIHLDFRKLKNGQSLFDIFSLHQLYLLGELCYNLSELFAVKYKLK